MTARGEDGVSIADPMGRSRGGGVTPYRMPDGTLKHRARLYHEGKETPLGLFDLESDAQAAVDNARARLAIDLDLPGTIMLSDWGIEWLRKRELAGVRGIRRERSVWRRWFAEADVSRLRLREITRLHVQRWIDEVSEGTVHRMKRTRDGMLSIDTGKRVSRQTVAHALRVMKSCLASAAEQGRIEASPAVDVRVPRMPAEAKGDGAKWTWLRPEEIAVLERATHVQHRVRGGGAIERELPLEHQSAWVFAIYTGLRTGEQRALRWEHVHLDAAKPYVAVRASADGPPKTCWVRDVPLLPPVIAILKRWKKTKPGVARAFVWPSDTGGMQSKNWHAGWRDWAVRLLPRHVRFYDCRHTCASHLVQGTWGRALTLPEVQQWMGHESIQTTMRYAHLAPGASVDIGVELAKNWAGATGNEPAKPDRKKSPR